MSKTIDPNDPTYHDKPLWVVYGHECTPSIMCVKLRAYNKAHELIPVGQAVEIVCVWGYSVYRGDPGFRTLGITLASFAERSVLGPHFYATLDGALGELRRLLTPSVECPWGPGCDGSCGVEEHPPANDPKEWP